MTATSLPGHGPAARRTISLITRLQRLRTTAPPSFLPAMMLSGFLFDLNNVPTTVRIIGELLPATHFLDLIKTLMLAGNVWSIIFKDCAILLAYALILLAAALRVTKKRID